MEKTFGKHFYDDKADALDRAKRLLADRTRAKDRSGLAAECGDETSPAGEVIV